MTAHALTAARLLLVAPVAVAFARPGFLHPVVLLVLVGVGIATDVADGRVARRMGTASPGGQLFDHGTDFLFVTSGLAGMAVAGVVTPVLPVLIVVAFTQYVLDSYLGAGGRRPPGGVASGAPPRKQLRMSGLGRWNGVLYFVPLVVVPVARLDALGTGSFLAGATGWIGYALAASTVLSIADRVGFLGER